MDELKNGDYVMCLDALGIEYVGPYMYIGKDKKGRHVIDVDGSYYSESDIRKVEDKKLVPFSADTFPKQIVLARCKRWDRPTRSIITKVAQSHVVFDDDEYSFRSLLDDCLISLDFGETWQKAGIED